MLLQNSDYNGNRRDNNGHVNGEGERHLVKRAIQNGNGKSNGNRDNNHYGNNGRGTSFLLGTALPQNNKNGNRHGNMLVDKDMIITIIMGKPKAQTGNRESNDSWTRNYVTTKQRQ